MDSFYAKIKLNNLEKDVDTENITINLSQEKIKAKKGEEAGAEKPKKWAKRDLLFLIFGIIGLVGGVTMAVLPYVLPKEAKDALSFPAIPSAPASTEKTYSSLTGVELANAADKTAPAFCIQTPNGTDGARPQSGMFDAGVVFEAIAEAGITRFATIYQNPNQAIIGPLRSLRMYYLDWDTPFDCTIVHAGGAADALAAVSAGGYKDLSEDYAYMYRGTYSSRLWNNLFTTSSYLKKMAADRGYTSSNIQGFARLAPEEATKKRVDDTVEEKLVITKAAKANTGKLVPTTTAMNFNFGNWATFNVRYNYDAGSNTYKRSYADGEPHNVYNCPTDDLGERNPEDVCSLQQLSPSVVIAMMVNEQLSADRYHESITTIGSGVAYIFQNGVATKGTWNKASKESQIEFKDEAGKTISLIPGQTFISAVPNYGSVEY